MLTVVDAHTDVDDISSLVPPHSIKFVSFNEVCLQHVASQDTVIRSRILT